jgi:hypothetical protein
MGLHRCSLLSKLGRLIRAGKSIDPTVILDLELMWCDRNWARQSSIQLFYDIIHGELDPSTVFMDEP